MKYYIIISFCFLCLTNGNAQSYKDAFRNDICNCLEQEKLKLRLNENTYKKCFKETLPDYAVQIDAEIEEEDVNKRFNLGQLARKDLMLAYKYELIYTCDTYYEFIESFRVSKKLIARENAKESDLDQLNEEVAMRPNSISYLRRAQLYFRLNNLDAAEADVKKSIEVNPYSENFKAIRNETLLLAWIYEDQERYLEAITLYDNLSFGLYDTDVAILRAIVDKKSGGTMANIPVVNNESKSSTSKNSRTRDKSTSQRRNTKKSSKVTKQKNVSKKKDTSNLKKLFKIDQ